MKEKEMGRFKRKEKSFAVASSAQWNGTFFISKVKLYKRKGIPMFPSIVRSVTPSWFSIASPKEDSTITDLNPFPDLLLAINTLEEHSRGKNGYTCVISY